jgi:cation diffusion facilitator CzcD-associated flavoprotein CzcO
VTGNIGIVGAGIAGLHLALYLQKHGVEATLVTDRAPEDYRQSRLLNTVAHHHVTLTREDYLGVNHWSAPKFHYYTSSIFPSRCAFVATSPRALDYRIYLPALMEDFERRGGKIEYRRIEEGDIRPLVARFDLLVVATGKGPLGQLFTYRPSRSGSCVSVCTPAFDNPTQ